MIGTRRVTRTPSRDEQLSVVLRVCDDGTHFCTCGAGKHPHERLPMLQPTTPDSSDAKQKGPPTDAVFRWRHEATRQQPGPATT